MIGHALQHSHGDAIGQILHLAAKARRREINHGVYQALHGRVTAGPFEGMLLPDQTSWLDGDIAPKLLGVYEAELHPLVTQVVAADYPIVVNVGCAEGFYAIGLARLMSHTKVYAFDVNVDAQRVCREAAIRNGVADRVIVSGRCDAAAIETILPNATVAFLFLDCEGGEKDLLDPVTAPALKHCDFAVECHDFYDRDISPAIVGRFEATHTISVIHEGPRDPNTVPMLRSLDSLDRWLTVCEFRPETMHWLVGTRKSDAGSSAS